MTANAAIPDAAVGRPKALANQTLNVTEKIFSQSPLKNTVKRRDFVSGLAWTSTTTVPATRLVSMLEFRKQSPTTETEMPYRTLGKTGEKVSCVGLGGFHLGQSHLEEPDAIRPFPSAVDRGINFSDNSWDYNQGIR